MAGFVAIDTSHAAAAGFFRGELEPERVKDFLPFHADIRKRRLFRAMGEQACRGIGGTHVNAVINFRRGQAAVLDLARQPFMEQMHAIVRAV